MDHVKPKSWATRLALLALAIVIAMGSLGACASNAAGDTSANSSADAKNDKQVIVAMGTGSEPVAGFDPIINWGAGEHAHEPLIQSTLFVTNTDMYLENDLAMSYECSEDGLTWTFTIRDDAYFTDGEKLTASDVAFTFNEIMNNPASEIDLSMVEGVEATDDTTFVLSLKKPFNAILYNIAVIGIVPEHAYDENYGNNPIGSGRYMLEQWDKGQQVIFVANPDYYGEAPKMERVVVVFMDEDAALAATQSKQVDVAATSAVYSNQTADGYEIFVCESVDSRGISLPTSPAGGTKESDDQEFSTGNDVTADLALRQALNYAVDRETMVDNVLNGYGTVAYSVSDGMPWSSQKMVAEYDVDKAIKILEDGGWVLGDDGIREKDGLRASFTVWYSASDSVRQGLAAEFSNQMKAVGIEVLTEGADWSDLYPHQYASPVLWGWGSNSPAELYQLYYSTGTANFSGYTSKTLDGYYDQALATQNIEDSYQYWQLGTPEAGPEGAATWVWFANIDHLYFKDVNLTIAEQKLHPHGHGWAIVNNVDQWSWK